MTRLILLAALIGTASYFSPHLRADESPKRPFEVDVQTDIPYRTDKEADPIKHKLDIYTPKGQKDFPVLMFVHGGAWRSGNKAMYASIGATFAKQGIGVVIINYRLTGTPNKIKHPDHVNDVADAFAWVHANIAKYGGRPDRVFISGHSAGGHLVSLLATDESYLKARNLSFADIRGVLSLSGVYEIIPNIRVFDDQFGTDLAVCKAASPINHTAGKHPPFLICYAENDFPTLDVGAERFCKKLVNDKVDATVAKIAGRNHITIIIQLAVNTDDPCTALMLDFIAKHSEWKRAVK